MRLPKDLTAIVSIVGTSTGEKFFDYMPRFDAESPDLGRICLITPRHEYARWGGAFPDNIPLWDPIHDGAHRIIAIRREKDSSPVMVRALNERWKPTVDGVVATLIPAYNLKSIALDINYPKRIEGEGTVMAFYGLATDVARAYHEGKHLYGIKLDSGQTVLVAGEGAASHSNHRVRIVGKKTGKTDLIQRPVYLAEELSEIRNVA